MVVDDIVPEETADEAKRSEATVNSRCSTLDEVPGFGLKLGQVRVSVVKVSNRNYPMIDPKVWQDVEACYRSGTDMLATKVQESGHCCQTSIRSKD